MSDVLGFLQSDACRQLVTVLLHSLWQAPVLAVLLWLALRSLPARSVNARYALSLVFLLLLPLLMAGTWSVLSNSTSPVSEPAVTAVSGAASAQPAPSLRPAPTTTRVIVVRQNPPYNWTAPAAGIWFGGVVLMLIRAVVSLAGANGLRRRCAPLNDPRVLSLFDDLCRQLRLRRRVRVLIGAICAPATMGLLWPAVLLPVELISSMPPGQLRLILAHELAHIRRYDYAVNLVQILLEALLFFNPAVYWLNHRIRREREAACDALAVSIAGGPREYAELLADYAVRMKSNAVLAFAGHEDPPMTDRLRRLLSSAHHPNSRLPILSLAATLGVGLLCLGLLCAGTSWAVSKVLTPKERMEKLNKAWEGHEHLFDTRYSRRRDEMANIAGIVTTKDGAPLPEKASIYILSKQGRSPVGFSTFVKQGKFSVPVFPGMITVAAFADGYAPTIIEPRSISPKGTWDDAVLVLDSGFSATVNVLDENGRPIHGAQVFIAELIGEQPSEFSIRERVVRSDAGGVALLAHLSPEFMFQLQFLAPGFQHEKVKRYIKPDETFTVNLRRAKVTEGRVIDRDSGRPIPSPRISFLVVLRQVEHSYPILTDSPHEHPKVAVVGDDEGRFELSSLRDDATYRLFVEADGHAPSFVQNVGGGQDNLEVKLGPALHVTGRVVGPEERQAGEGDSPPIFYSYFQPIPTFPVQQWSRLPLDTFDGEKHFKIENLWEGDLTIRTGTLSQTLKVTAPMEDVIVDLTEPPEKELPPMRPVVIRLLAPEEAPPTGTVRVSVLPDEPGAKEWTREMRLEDGRVRLEVPVPCKVRVRPGVLVGYSFESQDPWNCDAGPSNTAFVIEIPVDPAGAITGLVLDAQGNPVSDLLVSAKIALPPTLESAMLPPDHTQPTATTGPDGRFMLTPVPLDVPCVVTAQARSQSQYAATDVLTLDNMTPLQECVIRFHEGVSIRGRVLLPNNFPAQSIPVELWYRPAKRTSRRVRNVSTDADGEFEMLDLFPDALEKYELIVDPERDCRQTGGHFAPGDENIVITLEQGETLRGIAVDQETGKHLPNIRIHARPTKPVPGEVRYRDAVDADTPTNEEGEFIFTRLGKAEYTLHVQEGRTEGPPHIIAGKDTYIELRVTRKQ
jgi:beta-lactamase regulating signal transducer with metallopeptidase domain